jgi:hypothetical protein
MKLAKHFVTVAHTAAIVLIQTYHLQFNVQQVITLQLET